MPLDKERLRARTAWLEPAWTGAAAGIAALYGQWPAIAMYRGMDLARHGEGWIVLLLAAPIAFVLAAGLAYALFCAVDCAEDAEPLGILESLGLCAVGFAGAAYYAVRVRKRWRT